MDLSGRGIYLINSRIRSESQFLRKELFNSTLNFWSFAIKYVNVCIKIRTYYRNDKMNMTQI